MCINYPDKLFFNRKNIYFLNNYCQKNNTYTIKLLEISFKLKEKLSIYWFSKPILSQTDPSIEKKYFFSCNIVTFKIIPLISHLIYHTVNYKIIIYVRVL